MQQNLRRGRFRESIAGKPPATLDELLVRAEKYIRIEETSDVRAMTPSKRRAEEESRSKRPLNDRHRDRGRGPALDTTRYTPLNAPRAEILAVAERQGIVQWPLQMRENPKRMKSDKYCLFHKDRGHSTEECLHLKDEIEKLIRRGYLKEYVDRNNRPREGNSRPPQERRERETRGNQPNQTTPNCRGHRVISGGPAGGDSARARKAALRAARNHSGIPKPGDGNQQCRVDQSKHTADKLQREHSGTHRRSDASHLLGFIPKASNQDGKVPCRGRPFRIQCDIRKTKPKLFPSNSFNVSPEAEIPNPNGVGEEVGDRRQARECYANSLKKESKGRPNEASSNGKAPTMSEAGEVRGEQDPLIIKKRKVEERIGPAEEVKTIELAQQPDTKEVKIGLC
ncbi:UNVERIFIED_CONTAM: hypothetical protein Sradi_4335700 [Sesamum radiatum]|uniref:Uncharacterized protein n=1 Tax=Sesamum radiatum TaxID=300843 RepID=A0AAW2NNH9_SESRA